MLTPLSEQPWGRWELDAPQLLRGFSGYLRGSCAQLGGRVGGSEPPPAAPGAARGTGEVGALPSIPCALRGLPSSCPACPALTPKNPAEPQVCARRALGCPWHLCGETHRRSMETCNVPLAPTEMRVPLWCKGARKSPVRGCPRRGDRTGTGRWMLLQNSACRLSLPGLEVGCTPRTTLPTPGLGSAEQVSAPALSPRGRGASPAAPAPVPSRERVHPSIHPSPTGGAGVLPGRRHRPAELGARRPRPRSEGPGGDQTPALSGTPAHRRAAAGEFSSFPIKCRNSGV